MDQNSLAETSKQAMVRLVKNLTVLGKKARDEFSGLCKDVSTPHDVSASVEVGEYKNQTKLTQIGWVATDIKGRRLFFTTKPRYSKSAGTWSNKNESLYIKKSRVPKDPSATLAPVMAELL